MPSLEQAPAGMEAAVTLKQRGFEPVVFDKGNEIGGNLHIAKLPPFKGKFDWAAGYYKSMAAKLGIDVRLNTEATADMIKALNPYAVFIASGSNAVSIPLARPRYRARISEPRRASSEYVF